MDRTQEFIDEGLIMTEFNHQNVLPLVGIVVSQNKPLLLFPYMANGTVNEYLRNNKYVSYELDCVFM